MNVFDKIKVKTALSPKRKFQFNPSHITTTDFFKLSPVFCREVIPGEEIKVDMMSFARLDPLPVPTFGHARMYNRAFFVPYRTIFRQWNEFITDSLASDGRGGVGLVPNVPTVSNADLVQLFTRNNDFATVSQSEPETYDFFGSGGAGYITLTPLGRQAYKVLRSLGYDIYWSNGTSGDPMSEFYNQEFSALRILAVAKIFIDWYYPAQYVGDSDYNLINTLCDFTASAGTVLSLGWDQLASIFRVICFSNYSSDYFTAAFDNPAGPSNGQFSNFSVPDITQSDTQRTYTDSVETGQFSQPSTPTILSRNASGQTAGITYLSDYIIDSLRRLTDYMMRHQLVGARALDRYLARFGVELSADKLNRCYSCGTYMVDLVISDVMANADTFDESLGTGELLGSYAGKGIVNREGDVGHFSFESKDKEYGLFIIMSSLIPDIGYVTGLDRNIMHKTRLDFFTPEFDAMGCQAIRSTEVFLPNGMPIERLGGDGPEQIFGFTPRYAEYKMMRDSLTGDFNIRSISQSGSTSSAWHLFRLFGYEYGASPDLYNGYELVQYFNQLKHSKSFMLGKQALQFNRIFYNTEDTADKFVTVHHFNVESYANAKSLYDNYDWDPEASGKPVTASVNGTRVN